MWFNIIAGFIIPWIFGIYMYRKAPEIFFTTAPITALIAVTCNQAGIHLGLWEVHHMPKVTLADSIFLDLGIFTIAGSSFTYFLAYKKKNRYLLLTLFTLGMTSLEYLSIVMEIVSYSDKWNIFYTFLMYAAGFLTLYFISKKLVKLGVYP
ncbi:hypothetical protein [Halobacillus campisalis]|uniref:Uncharacterized protein n=1 Tax=Halobacillus campisalis TaxID=435909 RepID=A0ABW2K6Y9_9BACI|nr:hypothetical protein [Halobacillus campisalis]